MGTFIEFCRTTDDDDDGGGGGGGGGTLHSSTVNRVKVAGVNISAKTIKEVVVGRPSTCTPRSRQCIMH